jgi:hypothetical protein
LLACAGGALDAFVYLNHGHVFAAAMTGNGVLLGVALLHHDTMQAVHHLLPILAFLVGAFAAKVLDRKMKRYAVAVGLLCEIAVLFIASWLPGGFPDLAYVPLIAMAAAYQITSFRTADSFAYNSTFMTGNMRTASMASLRASSLPAHPTSAQPGCASFETSPCSSPALWPVRSWGPSSRRACSTTPSGSSLCRWSSCFCSWCGTAGLHRPRLKSRWAALTLRAARRLLILHFRCHPDCSAEIRSLRNLMLWRWPRPAWTPLLAPPVR